MTDPNDSVVDKIRKLLAMRVDRGCTPNEAATALEMAQALLLKHNLEIASVLEESPEKVGSSVGLVSVHESRGYLWKKHLLHVLARNTLCRVVSQDREKTVHVVGARENVRAVLTMYTWVGEQLEISAPKARKAYRDVGGQANGRTWTASFFTGAVETIGVRLSKPMAEFSRGEGRALVVANGNDLAEAIRKIFPRLRRGKRVNVGSDEGYASGQRTGEGISFARPQQLGSGRLALPSGR